MVLIYTLIKVSVEAFLHPCAESLERLCMHNLGLLVNTFYL